MMPSRILMVMKLARESPLPYLTQHFGPFMTGKIIGGATAPPAPPAPTPLVLDFVTLTMT